MQNMKPEDEKKNQKMPRVGLRPFAEIIVELAGGDVEKKLTADLAEIVRAVDDTGGKGELTLKLKVTKDAKVVSIVADVKPVIPRNAHEATMFFTDEKGGLHRENPRQTKMALGETPRVVKTDDSDDKEGDDN